MLCSVDDIEEFLLMKSVCERLESHELYFPCCMSLH